MATISKGEGDMGRKKKTYSDEQKRKCIGELLEGRSFGEVCSANGVAPSTLSDWKKAFLKSGAKDREMRQLEKRARDLEERLRQATELIWQKELEIELLKKDLRF